MTGVKKTARRGYGGRSAAELSAERRQRLMDTGLELFGTDGYLPTTVEKLCSHAKVTTRHFYEHFRDREALLIALFEDILADTRNRVVAVMLDPAIPAERRFEAALDVFLAAHLDDPRRARITTQEILGVSARAEAARNQVISGFAGLIEAYLGSLAAAGKLPPRNYRVLAVGIVGAMHELQIAWLDGSLGVSRQELVAELGFLVAAMVKGASA
ncbi:MAG TPA: TetR/AcrR family transcriptional regulator [Fluviicoccus sp.]|nr:TetR/AcrR family transcriptional regulator [Fluviicoccus sp.]